MLTRRRRTREEELHLTLTPSERSLFGRIKSALGAREHWVEVLKCLDLYAAVRRGEGGRGDTPLPTTQHICPPIIPSPLSSLQEVLSRHELVALLADVFGPANMRLLDELRAVLNARGTLEMTVRGVAWGQKGVGNPSRDVSCATAVLLPPSSAAAPPLPQPEDVWFTMPVGEVDFSACPRCTPSYRALPAGYPRLACTERSQLERCVRGRGCGWGSAPPPHCSPPCPPLP